MHCPNRNKLVGTYGVGEYRYGSPLKVCPKCKTEYINPVFHEIEIDGIAPEAFDIKRMLIALVYGIVLFVTGAEIPDMPYGFISRATTSRKNISPRSIYTSAKPKLRKITDRKG